MQLSNADLSFILNHLGETRENYLQAVSPPIFQTSNFTFTDVASMRNSLQDEMNTPFYTRGCNPTVAILRQKVAALEQAEDALIFSSGSTAIAAAVMSQLAQGDHIICVQKPYSWTNKLLDRLLKRFGIQSTFIDGTDAQNYAHAIQANTKVLFLESPNSITFELQDIEAVVAIAKQHNLVTIIDNSYCSPLFQQPIAMGVDLVTHSASKYLNGHSDIVAGVLCGNREMIRAIFESEYMTLGGIISPHDAWLMIRGLRTLPLRMNHVSQSTQKVVDYLEQHPKIEKVYYPFAKSFPQYELAQKQMKAATGLFSIQIKATTIEEVEHFCNRLQCFLLACSWGGHESLIFPMCVLYQSQNYSSTELPWNLVRVCIGLEETDVLIKDLEQALEGI